MAVSPPLALYTWYHQHKKKDLGVGHKDWLQFLQEQAKQDDKKKCYTKSSIKTKTCKGSAKDDCVSLNAQDEKKTKGDLDDFKLKQLQHEGNYLDASSSHHSVKAQCRSQKEELGEGWSHSSSHNQKMATAQLPIGGAPVTPLSALLNTSLSSSTLLLPHGNNTSLEETSLYSPTLPLCDETFSPAKMGDSPRDTIMESLAGNLDGSEVSWSSALATPTSTCLGQVIDGTSPSTLERQTLHPRQGLRENVLARSLFSPRTSGATSSSSSGEVSPGLGIIKCFSPVPRFSCRFVPSTQAHRPNCGESSNPGWLEGGTQGFRVNFSIEKKTAQEKYAGVTQKDNLGSKAITESGANSPDQQIALSHSCAGVRPDQTSTPTQSRPVRARHLVLTSESPESPGIIEPILPAQGMERNERVEETDAPTVIREKIDKLNEKVIDSDGFEDYTSDVEYSYGSAEDPFDIICSPVSKVKQKRKNHISGTKMTSRTSNQKSEENIVLRNPNESSVEIKQKPSLGDALGCYRILSGSPSKKGESSCEGNSCFNKAKSNDARDTSCKLEDRRDEHSLETIACQAARGLTTKSNPNVASRLPGKLVAALHGETETGNVLENTNEDKEYHVITSFDNRKDISTMQFSEQQKIISTETLSLSKKKRFTKSFVYPADLGEGYGGLNVSYTETLRGDDGGSKATPGRKGDTCTIPAKGLYETRQNEALMPFDEETTGITPSNRLSDEKGTDAAMPDRKRAIYSSPTIPCKAGEELSTITLKQTEFLPLTNLGNIDTLGTSLRSSFEHVEAVGYGHKRTYLGTRESPVVKKENEGSNPNLQVVPMAPLVLDKKEYSMKVTGKISANSSTLMENINSKYDNTFKNMKVSFLNTSSELSSVVHSDSEKNHEAECYTNLPQRNVPQIYGIGNLSIQGTEGQRKEMVFSGLNNQLVSDTYSDIDFSDSDLDISIPAGEENVTYDKNMKANKGSNQPTDIAHEEKLGGGLFNKNQSDKDLGFNGFMTGSGKQVKISEKALLLARKFLEEELSDEESLSPQQVPPGKFITIDNSMKGEESKFIGIHKIPNSDQFAILETGSLNLTASPSAESNAGVSETVEKFQKINKSNECEMKNYNKKELLQGKSVKEVSNADSDVAAENKITGSNINHEDNKKNSEVANSQVIEVADVSWPRSEHSASVNICETSSRKTVDCSVIQSFCSKHESTADGTVTESEEEGREASGRVHLHCEESSMCSEQVKLPEDAEKSSKPPAESKSSAFQGFCTAAGSRIRTSTDAVRRAQLLWEEVDVKMHHSLNRETNMESECDILKTEQAGRHTQLRKNGNAVDSSEKNELNERNNITSTALDTGVGFHTARGKKVSVNETSITQACLLWKETAICEAAVPDNARAQKKQSTSSVNKYIVEVDEGFHTAKGSKISVKESSIAQACSLWHETVSCKLQLLDHGEPKVQLSICNDYEHDEEVSCKRATGKSDGQPLKRMKSAPILKNVQINLKDRNSLSEKVSDNELPEVQVFVATNDRGNLSNRNTEASEKWNVCDKVSGKSLPRPAGMSTASYIGSSITGDVNVIKSENLAMKPKRLFEDNYLQSGNGYQSPELVTQRRKDCKSYEKFYLHKQKVDTIEGSAMEMSKNIGKKSTTSGQSLHMNPLNDVMRQDSVEKDSSTLCRQGNEEVKADVNQIIEPNTSLNTKEGKVLKGASQKVEIDYQAKSCNDSESMHQGNHFHEAKHFQSPTPEFCGFLTGNKKQVKISNESLQVAKQLLQERSSNEGSPEKFIKPSCGIGECRRSSNNEQVATVESFLAMADQYTGDAGETHEVMHGSPILGSQKRGKGRISKRTSCTMTCQDLQSDSVNNHEISDISDVTEAFLKDHLLDYEEKAKDCISQRKRLRGLCQDEGDSFTIKKLRIDVEINQHENMKDCHGTEVSRRLAQKQQEKLVQHKDLKAVQPLPGFLYKLRKERKEDRIKLQSLGCLKAHRNSRPEVLGVTFSSALQYRFEVQDSRCDTIDCGDGCVVVPGTDGCVGVKELELGFLAMSAVHPGLLLPSWVPNHYRLIVWQLASIERRLPHCGHALTLKNVAARLKYRYDREIDRAERSILRKITEQDDVPQKTMILCVTYVKMDPEVETKESVKSRTTGPKLLPLLELTDGWYGIGAVVDRAMAQLIEKGKVKVGSKLVLHGTELVGSSSPCHPLQAPSMLCLRLHTNMTRRARWWARLGLLPQRGPIPSLIETTFSDGGLVGQVNVMVARLYILYYEPSQGLFMGEKAYMKKLRETEKERERVIDKITAEVEKEICQQEKEEETKRERRTITPEEIRGLTLGQEISRLVDETADPSSLEGLLTPHQLQLARIWRERHAEEAKRKLYDEVTRRLAKIEKPFEAVPLLKVRIIDGKREGALVTVWRPSLEFRETLSEESFFTIHYLMAAGFRWGSRQFTSTRQTRWERSMRGPKLWCSEYARSVTPLCLTNSEELNPLWQEVDVTGVVLRVGKPNAKFQTVHLVDHHLNILAVNFWGGLKKCGFEDSILEGTVICLMNCSWRRHSGSTIGCIHFTELSIATCSPSNTHLVEASTHLRDSIKDMQKLLSEGNRILDGQFHSLAFPEKGLQSYEKPVKCKQQDGSIEGRPLQATDENIAGSSKLNRQEQQAMEVQSKLRILGQYGSPGCPQELLSPASQRTRKPFQMPIRKPLNISEKEVQEEN